MRRRKILRTSRKLVPSTDRQTGHSLGLKHTALKKIMFDLTFLRSR